MFYSVVLFTPCNAQDPMTYCFQSLNLLVCEEVQAKEKEIDGTLSLVLSLPEGKCQQRNPLVYKELTAHALVNFLLTDDVMVIYRYVN